MVLISRVTDYFSNVVFYGGIFGGIGYLASRMVNQIHPYAALVCGATAGVTTVLFFNKSAHLARKMMGVVILAIAPYKICEMLELPMTFRACLIVTGLTSALAIFVQIIHERSIRRQENLKWKKLEAKMDRKSQRI